MNPQRLAITGAVVTISVSVLYLLGWWLLWRVLVTNPLPGALYVMPFSAVGCLLCAAGLMAAVRGAPEQRIQAWALAVIVLASIILLEYMLGVTDGIEEYLFAEEAQALLGGSSPGRPAPQAALTLLFLGLALWFLARPRTYRFDFADLGIGVALFLSFTILLGHLYQARALYQSAGGGSVGMSLVETLMLLTLSVGALSLNPQGALASVMSTEGVGAAKRRILPMIVLTPVLLGQIQYLAVKYQALEFSLALALTVTANIVVFIALSEWVGRMLARIEQERTGVFVERETKAKEEGKTDMLTGLSNRRGWDQAVAQAEAKCTREGLNACVIVIDLDGLKRINDTLGHAKGDEFIRRAGSALRLAARREDHLARLGGDEFAYLSVGCQPEHAGHVLKRLAQSLQKANVAASLGHAMRDLSGSIAAAFQEADQAMYQHKRARKAQGAAPPPQQVA
jgi:diguanylate cyclase (GGDEF)-like protein